MRKISQLIWMAALGLVAAGCSGPLSPQAQQQLQSGYDYYAAGSDEQVVTTLEAFLAENARCSRADEAYYLRGLARQRLGRRDPAREDLQAALAATDKPELRGKTLLALGEMAYEDDDMTLAESLYRRALEDLDDTRPPADQARYRLGSVLQRQGRWDEADSQLDRVVHFFADTHLGRLAARRSHSTVWTIQTAAFRQRSRAQAAAATLRTDGLQAAARGMLHESEPLFVVQVGRFATYEQAAAALPAAQAHAADAFIVPTP